MHAAELREKARSLALAGVNDCEIARRLGLPRTTVRDMRVPRRTERPTCPRCWRPTRAVRFTAGEYAELLGLYLGDGCIVEAGRTQRLRLALDARHPQVVAETRALLAGCFPENRAAVVGADAGATAVVSMYCSHLGCLFPQHGSGQKHRRRIDLEPWQDDLVARAPWSFLRGLMHSDGCFFVNRTGRYTYLSADFCNVSADIRRLFVATCERVGVHARESGPRVRIYRRESVALLAAFVGIKR
ncbi:MAG TPA: hypothetical protein VHF89_13750 [Solirubrobacteraceae bacterium]|nr:hypothetical protein [Solirubrobacteraceae bacterium]